MLNTTSPGSSTPHYAQSTIESRPKDRYRQGTTSSGKVKGNSPDRKCPRLCEEDGIDVHDIEIKITANSERNRTYAAEDYGDTDADVWHRYNDTHSSRGIVPTPPTSTSGRTSQRGRPCRLVQPSTKTEFENRREKAERNLSPRREYVLKDEQEYIDQIRRLTEENKDLKKLERDHRKCETKQQEIYDMLNRYKGQLEISENKCLSFEDDNKIFAKMLEKEKQYNNASKLNHEQEIKMLKNKHETELRKYAFQLDRMRKEKQNIDINLPNKYKASMESTAEMEEQIREYQSKYEKMVKIIEQFKTVNKESNEARYKMEHQLQRKIDDLASVEETHRTCLEIRDEQKGVIRDLKNELSACEKNYEMLHQEYDDLNVRLEEGKMKNQSKEMSTFQNMEKEVSVLLMEKEIAVNKLQDADDTIQELHRNLEKRENRIRSLTEQLLRSEEKASKLSDKLKDARDDRKEVVEESLQRLQIQNENQKLVLVQATKRAEDLSKQSLSLQRYKDEAERITNNLSKDLNEHVKKNESLDKQVKQLLERNATILRDKESAVIQINKLTSILHDKEREIQSLIGERSRFAETSEETEKTLRKDVSSYRSAYDKMARENGNLSEQCSTLQQEKASLLKDKEDAQKQIMELKQTSQSMERKIESLTNDLTSYRNSNEDLLSIHDKEKGLLEKDKKRAGIEINDLKRALHDKEKEIGSINDELNRFKEHVAMLSNEVQLIQKSREEAVSNSEKRFHKEKASLESDYEKAILKINDISKECANLHKDKKSTALLVEKLSKTVEDRETKIHSLEAELSRFEEQISRLSDEIKTLHSSKGRAADEKMQELLKANYSLKTDLTKAKSKYEDLSKKCENMLMENEDAAHNIRQLSRDVQDKDQEINFLNTELTRVEDTVQELKDQKRDGQNTEQKINKLSKAVRDKEDEIESLIDQLSQSEDKNASLEEKLRNVKIGGGSVHERIQQLQEENASLKSALVQTSAESKDKIAALEEKFRNMKAGGGSMQERMQQLQKENTSLKSALVQKSTNLEKLRRDYDVVKREKDHALNRLGEVAGAKLNTGCQIPVTADLCEENREKLRDHNPGIADLSDENRPINLGEKFNQLHDDQWTDAIENLEEMRYTETDGIRYLIDILKRVFEECVRISEDNFIQLQELTGTKNLPSDQLKKVKDLRRATAVHSVNIVKPLVNKVMSTVFKNEKDACQTYIDRSIELCWLMCVQDPPVVIDFIAVRGTDIDDQKFRKFTKTGTKIDFLVWPVIRLCKNGPPLQKGVVQPL